MSARRPEATHSAIVPAGDVTLPGDLTVPDEARGIVLFAHGSGSSRRSSRNRRVAETLNDSGFVTLLFDLLTEVESRDRRNVFDIPLLAERLWHAATWVGAQADVSDLPLGYFGASTGAAAALIAAAHRPVAAVVSRGGRPDLAKDHLSAVTSPTLLIVGRADSAVLQLNEAALESLNGIKKLAVVPGASHLFEEPGCLKEVARLAEEWFGRYLVSG